jgi:hypothetical protein
MIDRDQTPQIRQPTVSPDGYIRLPFNHFSEMEFVHLTSDFDPDFLVELNIQAVPAITAGFSEWVSTTQPAISLGWGWFVHNRSRRLLVAPDVIRSNVMLIDVRGYDLGAAVTSSIFNTWLSIHDWQGDVGAVLRHPTSH